jgi:hypothetical protein
MDTPDGRDGKNTYLQENIYSIGEVKLIYIRINGDRID